MRAVSCRTLRLGSFDVLRYMSDGRGIFFKDSLAADIGHIVGVVVFAAWVTSTVAVSRSFRD